MTSRLSQTSRRAEEVIAARLQRRLEREFRARAQRKRAVVTAVSLASAGVLLLGVGGIAVAAKATEARGEPQSRTVLAEAVTDAPAVPVPAREESGVEPADDTAAVVRPDPEEPSERTAEKPAEKPALETGNKAKPSAQRFTIDIGDFGYEPAAIKASSDSPIILTVAQGEGCAAGFTIPSLGIDADNSAGSATLELGRLDPGTYRFACAMDMVEGRLVVE